MAAIDDEIRASNEETRKYRASRDRSLDALLEGDGSLLAVIEAVKGHSDPAWFDASGWERHIDDEPTLETLCYYVAEHMTWVPCNRESEFAGHLMAAILARVPGTRPGAMPALDAVASLGDECYSYDTGWQCNVCNGKGPGYSPAPGTGPDGYDHKDWYPVLAIEGYRKLAEESGNDEEGTP